MSKSFVETFVFFFFTPQQWRDLTLIKTRHSGGIFVIIIK